MALNQEGKVVPDLPANKFQVTAQQQTVAPGPDGRVVSGVQVYFKTEGGVQSSVFVPDDQYNPSNVKAAVATKAHQLDTVQRMTG